MKELLIKAVIKAFVGLDIKPDSIRLEYPENPEHGDFSTNVAMANAKALKMSPKALAEKIVEAFQKEMQSGEADFIDSVSIAGPGFINFKLKDEVFAEKIVEIARGGAEYGWGSADRGKKIMVEYTDPNPFKVLHIGHLMSNAIGESISRLIESQGAAVKRANWQGDVGPHVAKAIWGAMKTPGKTEGHRDASFWGEAYVRGAEAYETDESSKKEIEDINKKIYAGSDPAINALYEQGRAESLDTFESVYKRLGTKFDNYFFEGKEGRNGESVVREHLKNGVFEKSDGAIVFRGEKYGLHTRVFITSHGLPTYETKELGLNAEKFKIYPDLTESVIVTANEQSDYFKVLLKVMGLIMPKIAERTKHISHGMMRFASGKMSSRKGNVISAESLIADIKKLVTEKIAGREFSPTEADEIADIVAIAAIKYTILRQSIGGDVIFDSAQSISFEGDSGPYLQYSAVRATAVLEKAEKEGIIDSRITNDKSRIITSEKVGLLEKLIARFPDIVARARAEYAPQLVATYLIELAGAFNSFYGNQVIVDKNDGLSAYYVALTKAFRTTMVNGLRLLGIKVPKRM